MPLALPAVDASMASQAHTCVLLKQMGNLSTRQTSNQRTIVAALALAVAALSGCYVVPRAGRANLNTA
jgi:hypothetical protein